jgi:hypothetical protein
MDVVRANLESGVDATAYFYTDLDDFSKYEKAVRRDPPRHHRPAGDDPTRPAD